MAETKRKGDLGEAMIMAEVLRRGYKVAIPIGEDWRYDLVVLRNEHLERVQCKYVESDGNIIEIKCLSSNNWSKIRYTSSTIDWLAAYDKTTEKCYFVPAKLLGDGRSLISLRVQPPKNGQVKGVLWAKNFEEW